MIRRPPRSTLFPTRRSSDLFEILQRNYLRRLGELDLVTRGAGVLGIAEVRSEEHTSELQSQSKIVCRLLLEKKKQHEAPRHDHVPHPSHSYTAHMLPLAQSP